MAQTKREIILDEIDRWRGEGLLDEDEYLFMRGRYDQGAPTLALDAPTALDVQARRGRVPSAPTTAAYVTHLVGGILLGAALVALVQFFAPVGIAQPLLALGIAVSCIVAAFVAEAHRGILAAEAGFAAGLMAAGSVPFYAMTLPVLGIVTGILAVGVLLLRRGKTPIALLATVAFFVGAQGAARVDPFAIRAGAGEALFIAALIAFGGILVAQRRERWGGIALGAHGLLLTLATFPLLDSAGVTDPGLAALAIGAVLGLLFLIGLRLDTRPLVATTSATLTLAAIAFAFLALGPALAAIVLLLLGSVLVWQAETVRGYFGTAAFVRNG